MEINDEEEAVYRGEGHEDAVDLVPPRALLRHQYDKAEASPCKGLSRARQANEVNSAGGCKTSGGSSGEFVCGSELLERQPRISAAGYTEGKDMKTQSIWFHPVVE